MASITHRAGVARPFSDFIDKLNGPWHRRALQIFMVIVVAHWAEHIFQAHQVYVQGIARPKALGALGSVWPWLISSEGLHYTYALIMLAGLILLRPAFTGRARSRWTLALGIQIWHHFEHLLLLTQVALGANLLGRAAPTSILQIFFPRMELHLFYNALVFIPMVIAVIYHFRPPATDPKPTCSCARSAPAKA
jgi:hypothetical protein